MSHSIESIVSAARNGGIVPHFMPIKSGGGIAYEALGRLQVDEETVPPDTFLPMLKQHNMMEDFDISILRQSVARTAEWSQATHSRVHVHVNASREALVGELYCLAIEEVLDAGKVEAGELKIEILENVPFWKMPKVMKNLRQIRGMGVGLAIDDFPEVENPAELLEWLKDRELDLQTMKLDRGLVKRACCESNGRAQEEVRGYVLAAHNHGMSVVAEGIENEMYEAIMLRLGADALQGFGIGKPMPAQSAQHLSVAHHSKDVRRPAFMPIPVWQGAIWQPFPIAA